MKVLVEKHQLNDSINDISDIYLVVSAENIVRFELFNRDYEDDNHIVFLANSPGVRDRLGEFYSDISVNMMKRMIRCMNNAAR